MSTSDDLVTSYLQAFDELRARKRWSTQSVTRRIVALGLVDVASTFGYDRLEQAATEEERVGPSQYDEVAVLALTQGPAADVVERVIRSRDRLRQAKARPDKSVAFSLAAGIELSADTERAGERDLLALESIRTILEIQQAMIIAVIATATVTTTATA